MSDIDDLILDEQICIGSAFLDPETADQLLAILPADNFGQPKHRMIWDAIRSVRGCDAPANFQAVTESLGQMIDKAGGVSYFAKCTGTVLTGRDPVWHARQVSAGARLRRQFAQQDRHRQILKIADHERRATMLAELGADMLAEADRVPGAADEPVEGRAAPLHWPTFLTAEFAEVDFLAGRLMVRGEQAALVGDGKAGKSLFALDWAWRMSAGRPFLGDAARDPVRVMYVDQENGHDDIQERLLSLGATAETLTNLTYLSFPMFDPLNVAQGAAQLLAEVERHKSDVVILDTISRMVRGKENESDTWLELYRVMLRPLKKRKVSCARLDHFGKDVTRGGRGNSAKTQDVDVVWELIPTERGSTLLRLERTHSRNGKGADSLLIRRTGTLVGDRWKAGGTAHSIADESERPDPVPSPADKLRPAARRVLSVLTTTGKTVHQIGDDLAEQQGQLPLKTRTIQDALSTLADEKLADECPSDGKAAMWIIR